jgi:hypothetical protein
MATFLRPALKCERDFPKSFSWSYEHKNLRITGLGKKSRVKKEKGIG